MEKVRHHLFSPPTRIPEPPVPLDSMIRNMLMLVLESKVENWYAVPPMEIPGDWNAYDLQTIIVNKGFYPLATDEVLAGQAYLVYADVDFSTPHRFYKPPEIQRGYFRNPAINIDRVDDKLKLTFGYVFNTASGWRITNSTASHLEPEKLIVPSPVSYFKQR